MGGWSFDEAQITLKNGEIIMVKTGDKAVVNADGTVEITDAAGNIQKFDAEGNEINIINPESNEGLPQVFIAPGETRFFEYNGETFEIKNVGDKESYLGFLLLSTNNEPSRITIIGENLEITDKDANNDRVYLVGNNLTFNGVVGDDDVLTSGKNLTINLGDGNKTVGENKALQYLSVQESSSFKVNSDNDNGAYIINTDLGMFFMQVSLREGTEGEFKIDTDGKVVTVTASKEIDYNAIPLFPNENVKLVFNRGSIIGNSIGFDSTLVREITQKETYYIKRYGADDMECTVEPTDNTQPSSVEIYTFGTNGMVFIADNINLNLTSTGSSAKYLDTIYVLDAAVINDIIRTDDGGLTIIGKDGYGVHLSPDGTEEDIYNTNYISYENAEPVQQSAQEPEYYFDANGNKIYNYTGKEGVEYDQNGNIINKDEYYKYE